MPAKAQSSKARSAKAQSASMPDSAWLGKDSPKGLSIADTLFFDGGNFSSPVKRQLESSGTGPREFFRWTRRSPTPPLRYRQIPHYGIIQESTRTPKRVAPLPPTRFATFLRSGPATVELSSDSEAEHRGRDESQLQGSPGDSSLNSNSEMSPGTAPSPRASTLSSGTLSSSLETSSGPDFVAMPAVAEPGERESGDRREGDDDQRSCANCSRPILWSSACAFCPEDVVLPILVVLLVALVLLVHC